jgi:hypothetical protein
LHVAFSAGYFGSLTDGIYTPKGNVRLSFVDHGADLSKEGAQSLADKVNHHFNAIDFIITFWCVKHLSCAI